ncbi:hypothetical protein, partial [Prevotella histicola]|uniref:hypothetical protein n=1 Tax=Prevotella histicola TaxID=470565 RepID=UPI0028F12C9B
TFLGKSLDFTLGSRRRGCERKREDMGGSLSLEGEPPQAPPKEGMCLAGYRMLGVGDIKEKRIKP